MLQLPGPPALSAFRIAKLLERLQALEPAVTSGSTRASCTSSIWRSHSRRRGAARPRAAARPTGRAAGAAGRGEAGERLLVVPRAGTISPWSSKATDIAQVCGLTPCGASSAASHYRLQAAQPLGSERLLRLAPVLLDRMTERCCSMPAQAARLFEQRHAARRWRACRSRGGRARSSEADRRARARALGRMRSTTCSRAFAASGATRPTSSS